MSKTKKPRPKKQIAENLDVVGEIPQPYKRNLRRISREMSKIKRASARKLAADLLDLQEEAEAEVDNLRDEYNLDADHLVETAHGVIVRANDPRVKLEEINKDLPALSENDDFDGEPDEPDEPDEIEQALEAEAV